MSTQAAWAINKRRSGKQDMLSAPVPPPNTAMVVFYRNTLLGLMGPQLKLNWLDCARGQYEFWFIPTGQHSFSFTEQVESNKIGITFQVELTGVYSVENVIEIARLNPTNLDELLRNDLVGMIREYNGRYAPDSHHSLEQTIRSRLQNHSNLGLRLINPLVRVTPHTSIVQPNIESFTIDSGESARASKHQQELADLQRRVQIAEAEGRLEETRLTSKQRLDNLKITEMMRYFEMGRYAQFAMMLNNADDATMKEIVLRLEDQREQDVGRRWELVNRVLSADDSGLLANRLARMMPSINMFHNPLVNDRPPMLPPQSTRRLTAADIDHEAIDSYPDDDEEDQD